MYVDVFVTFLEHSSVSVVKRRSLSSYRSEELDLQAIVSDVQFLEVNTVTNPADWCELFNDV